MAKAPFYAERELPAGLLKEYFVDRVEPLDFLSKRLRQKTPARILLMGPERCGKTTLLLRAAADLGVRPLGWKCDRVLPASGKALLSAVIRGVYERYPEPAVGDLLERVQLNFEALVAEVLPQLGRVLGRLKPAPILVFDDAAPLRRLEEPYRGAFRAFLERAACHVVAALHAPPGAEAAPEPFTEFRVLALGPIPKRDAREFVAARLAAANVRIDAEALNALEGYAGGSPYYLQLLGARCHEAALKRGVRVVDLDVFSEALFAALESLAPELTGGFHGLDGKMRDVFAALCTLPAATPTGIGRALGIEPKNVIVLLSRLETVHGLVRRVERGRYEAAHPLLREFVKKEWARATL